MFYKYLFIYKSVIYLSVHTFAAFGRHPSPEPFIAMKTLCPTAQFNSSGIWTRSRLSYHWHTLCWVAYNVHFFLLLWYSPLVYTRCCCYSYLNSQPFAVSPPPPITLFCCPVSLLWTVLCTYWIFFALISCWLCICTLVSCAPVFLCVALWTWKNDLFAQCIWAI